MKINGMRQIAEVVGDTPRERLVSFLTSVARGTWWTRLKPNPDQPSWGAKIVHVSYSPGLFSVSESPGIGTVPMRVGANQRDVAKIADLLLLRG